MTASRIIKAAQRLGFTLDEVASLIDAGRHRHGPKTDPSLQAQARAKLAEVDQRIADLERIRAQARTFHQQVGAAGARSREIDGDGRRSRHDRARAAQFDRASCQSGLRPCCIAGSGAWNRPGRQLFLRFLPRLGKRFTTALRTFFFSSGVPCWATRASAFRA